MTAARLPRVLTCTCSLSSRISTVNQPLRVVRAVPLARLANQRHFSSGPSSTPWFVEDDSLPSNQRTIKDNDNANPRLATTPAPTAPPEHLHAALHGLHAHLSVSPFLDKSTLTYINAREADPDSTWVDWIVLATLRAGRERGIRGAVESIRQYLATNPIDLGHANVSPFAPPSNKPVVSGLPPPPSKHARSKKGGQVTRQDNDWAMLDAGDVVVHVMTLDARETWDIETLWKRVEKDSKSSQDGQ
ncbi:hypothetical protein OIV83_002525 [Microbotryomycetes sp. JL201]|nr:hypothetical protein OIV83_002525 [Microbotryomycetes sp. JL201]